MARLEDRLRRLEARAEARAGHSSQLHRASDGRPPWFTAEEWAERERTRAFRKLYGELGMPWPPTPRDPTQVREELFDLIENYRKETAA